MGKRVLLLAAPRPAPGYSPVHFGDNRPPQGLGYLSAYLEQRGHVTRIVDLYAFCGSEFANNAFVSQEEIGQQLDIDIDKTVDDFGPDFVGMYVHTMSFEPACTLSLHLRNAFPGIKQICGGPHPSLMPESMPETFDFVVSGEGEHAIADIVEGRNSDRFVRGRSLSSSELEELPWPDFDHFWGKPYNWSLNLFKRTMSPVLTISTSRGCPFRCRFCGVKRLYPKYIYISADHLFKRMRYLHSKYHVSTYYFREDNFTAHLGRLDRFCDLIIESEIDFRWVCESRVRELTHSIIRKMADAGCVGLYIGCESGSPRVLTNMRKDETPEDYIDKFPTLHDVGISTYTTWIYGTPGETSRDRALTEQLIERLNPVSIDRFIFIGIPISDYYEEILRGGTYEFIDKNGFVYPNGYLSLATHLYGFDDPRVSYVRELYRRHGIRAIEVNW